MEKFDETYTKTIKYFIISASASSKELKEIQNKKISEITNEEIITKPIEKFEEIPIDSKMYIKECKKITSLIPIILIQNEFNTMLENFNYEEDNFLMNIGSRLSLNYEQKLTFEEWRNVVSAEKQETVLFSLHKVYVKNSKFEVKLNYNFCTYLIEIYLNKLNNNIDNCKYTIQKGPIKTSYYSSCIENNNELTTILTYENSEEKSSETRNEKIFYSVDYSKLELDIEDAGIPIIIKRVDMETIKNEEKFDYSENNFETYFIDPECEKSWGVKKYTNNKNRKYEEEWSHTNLVDDGFEEKFHKYLDDGCGKHITEDHGKKMINKNELDYDYNDKYVHDVSNEDETTTKIGCDRYNKWNCYNFCNKKKNITHVNNEASNTKDNMEWKEKWDEEGNEKSCMKWGKNSEEEWEEGWKEIYDVISDYSEKKCYKKCKKFMEDREWYETWTEKNNGKPNCEKTCYKMNREGGNKFENYWGSIIVNYLDNKRMNYVGYINNDQKTEYVNYNHEDYKE